MRRFRENDRGLAEIVGTLMLVLIVVAAAVAFAAFVATYEQQELAQQSYEHNKALESLRVVSLTPGGPLNTSGEYPSVNITIASSDPNPTTITGLVLNGNAVTQDYFRVTGQSTWQLGGLVRGASNITLGTDGAAEINITFPASFGSANFDLLANSYIDMGLYTAYDNDFVFTYIPPVPVINVDTVPLGSGGGFTNALDGVASFQPGGNETIVSWAWSGTLTLTNCSGMPLDCIPSNPIALAPTFLTDTPAYGASVQTEVALSLNPFGNATSPDFANYTIELTVTNNDGLEGFGTVIYSAM
jgi:flagellin-like protein